MEEVSTLKLSSQQLRELLDQIIKDRSVVSNREPSYYRPDGNYRIVALEDVRVGSFFACIKGQRFEFTAKNRKHCIILHALERFGFVQTEVLFPTLRSKKRSKKEGLQTKALLSLAEEEGQGPEEHLSKAEQLELRTERLSLPTFNCTTGAAEIEDMYRED